MSKELSRNAFALDLNEVNLERLKDKDCTDAERLALALVLARSGMSIEATAETVGMGVHAVWKKVAPHVSRDEKDSLIEELALDASVHLALEVMDRLRTPGAMRSAEVIKAAQVMTAIVGRKRRWDAPEKDEAEQNEKSAMERLLEALEKGGKVVNVGKE